jgi:creatinine amidohydrolase/Fe(II)-dependent formamide hydrolase-like protein/GNAT superfamily N-acetyltransferase
MNKRKILDGNNTTNDWQKHTNDLLVFPIGAFEQHDAHLPLNTDIVNVDYFSRIITETFDAALLPTQGIATSLEHMGFRGSFSLKPETLMQIVRDIADEAERQNFKILIIVNGHGGNICLAPVCRDINRLDRKIKILLVNPFEFADKGITESSQKSLLDIHAGESETSRFMFENPNYSLERSERYSIKEEGIPLIQSDLTMFGAGCFNPSGSIGNYENASPEKGKKLIHSITSNMILFIEDRLGRIRKQPKYAGRGGLVMRKMISADMPELMDLTAQSKWNQLPDDWNFFMKNSPDGCFVMVHQGKSVGTITTIDYDHKVSWIGMVLVDSSFRRMGIASELMNMGINALSRCETIKLDATPAGKKVYDKLGFKDEYKLVRMVNHNIRSVSDRSPEVSPITVKDIPEVIEFDKNYFGVDRSSVIESLTSREAACCFKYHSAGRIKGFCLGRPGKNYTHIGPVVAETSVVAVNLVEAAINKLSGTAVVIDIMDLNSEFSEFLKQAGFTIQRPFIRMYKGENKNAGIQEKYFAIAGPELG